jgi:TRAP transporter TAXI family solute receptor
MNKKIASLVLCFVLIGLGFSAGSASAAPKHEEVTLTLYTMPSGGIVYTLGFALAELINKNSEWLRCNAVETASTFENLQYIVGHPDKKNVYLGSAVTIGVDQLAMAMKPYDKIGPWKKTKWVSLMASIGSPQITLDPNIKTWRDLDGKTYGLDTMGSTNQFMQEWLMDYAWKDRNKVKLTYGNTANIAVDRLLDGTIDITWTGAVMLGAGEYKDWKPMPPFERLLAARQVYIMELDEKDIAIAREKTGAESLALIGGEAKEIGKSKVPQWKGLLNSLGWLVHEDMDDEIVTEIIRVIYENADQFVNYHAVGKGITKETLGQLPVPRDSYHPAVIKFLEAKGQKVGR